MLLIAAQPDLEEASLLPDSPPADLEARLAVVVEEFTRITVATEGHLRSTLRLSLDPDPSHREKLIERGGRAIGRIEDALAPLREEHPDADVRRLALAIRSAIGIEALRPSR